VQKTFPEYDDKFFVALGNHDSYPNDQWDFAAKHTYQPEQGVRDLLSKWVPADQMDLYQEHGYYAKRIPELNARLLSINTGSCDFHNDFIWGAGSDANQQIDFLRENLVEAESLGEFAIFLGHIPDDCNHQY